MRLIFMGTPEFAIAPLDALVAAGHEIAAVYTQPPRPAGRGKRDRPSPVQSRAEALGLVVRHPATLKTEDAQTEFADFGAELAVVVAYGLILPSGILAAPLRGCLNIHASLLPRWRGAAPIQRAIMAGDAETGICIMEMEAGLDTGPVLLRRRTEIGLDETAGDLQARLAGLGAEAIVATLADLDALVPKPQQETGVTYAAKIEKTEAAIDWQRDAGDLARDIRGLSPFPGAWTRAAGRRLKLLRARPVPGSGAPGEVLAGGESLTVAAGSGAVALTELQGEGRGRQSAAEFLRGTRLPRGTILGDA